MRVAVVGTGVSGLVCAHLLHPRHDVTVYEAEHRPGGHAHTVQAAVDGGALPVDTGFLVYNERTYPGLVRLFARLGVATQPSDMSFSVSDEATGLEYRGSSAGTVFAQRSNALRPRFLRMLVDVGRFNRVARRLLHEDPGPSYTLDDLLAEGRWSRAFVDWYLIPLGSSIWSADPGSFTEMPAVTLARFFDRHGLLSVGDKPDWRTVSGGAAHYVEAVLSPLRAGGRVRLGAPVELVRRSFEGVELRQAGGHATEHFDHVVLATHSDQALQLLADPTPAEKEVLGAVRYRANEVVLHTDARFLPHNRRAWASWNYHRLAVNKDLVTMTYHLNQLQGLATDTPVLVTLNRGEDIDPPACCGASSTRTPCSTGLPSPPSPGTPR